MYIGLVHAPVHLLIMVVEYTLELSFSNRQFGTPETNSLAYDKEVQTSV